MDGNSPIWSMCSTVTLVRNITWKLGRSTQELCIEFSSKFFNSSYLSPLPSKFVDQLDQHFQNRFIRNVHFLAFESQAFRFQIATRPQRDLTSKKHLSQEEKAKALIIQYTL
eukprot:Gregarina_sp_Poly_1__9967@NODE_65_length_16489_cov_69_850445_g56_i0_p11_GENE_NODE_65_length_16489_cov_69_850445_g56_i0NODE_65_length_16489_cov_69_850445_g56_i0_p11_ORF_typecomplete_len112_score10_24_NODE_65_length_16489_cov_69_850445_g56_i032193554